MEPLSIVDAHVHFWNPGLLAYPWLDGIPKLRRPFLPADFASSTGDAPVEKIVFVECNCAPGDNLREVEHVARLAEAEPRIAGLVAYVDLTDAAGLDRTLDALSDYPLVKGIRHNIQGEPAGFCLQPAFVEGVRKVGRRGFTFDLCVTHDQLPEVVRLVELCPDTRFVLDHCGKPAIRQGLLEPWKGEIARLAARGHVWCKLSGLLTEADVERWREEDLVPYAEHVVEQFGIDRVLYGSDWPVLTLAGQYADWYGFTRRLTAGWSESERRRFYYENAVHFYGL
ncbi:MAG TPA: amidohydrolase [Longimicrobiales bacterium]